MTTTRRPRAPLPDWSESLREGTESLSMRSEGDPRASLAYGTAELEPPVSGAVPALVSEAVPALVSEAVPALDPVAEAGFGDERTKLDERTKVDVNRARLRRTPAPGDSRKDKRSRDEGDELVGATLGSYRLLDKIGKGGMGYVYRAEHVHLGREVALKLLRADYAKRRDAVARFFQEARTVNRVRHRNIVDVTDLVELEDGTTFIIMELLTGESLTEWTRRPLEVPRVLSVLAQICDGLAAAHSVHVVHRDLKPDNVIVTRDADGGELVKLLDFGVAKLIHREDDAVAVETAAGSVVGTPAYMSPEQAGGLAIDGRSDIYSLGAIMYELFCGQPMFRGRSFGEFVRKHLTEFPLPPRATPRGARMDPRLETIILRAIEKDPDRRYPNILELRDALLVLATAMRSLDPGSARAVLHAGESASLPASPSSAAYSGEEPHGIGLDSLGPKAANAVSIRQSHGATPTSQRVAPWYVWFVGGALAVGLGIGGAAWYALSTQRAAKPAAPAPVELRLTSEPAGAAVIEDGSSAVVCRTPCALTLAPAAQAASDVRHYVLRAAGFLDTPLAIDLHGAQRAFQVTLPTAAVAEPASPTPGEPGASAPQGPQEAASAPPPSAEPTVEVIDELEPLPTTPGAGAPQAQPQPARPQGRPRPAATPARSDLPDLDAVGTKPARPAPRSGASDLPDLDAIGTKPAKPVTRQAPDTSFGKPADKPAGKSADKSIDRSETIDPFRPNP